MKCDRCKSDTSTTIMSWFNQDMLCTSCSSIEKAHPDFRVAMNAVLQQEIIPRLSYEGIGWPGVEGRVDPLFVLVYGRH